MGSIGIDVILPSFNQVLGGVLAVAGVLGGVLNSVLGTANGLLGLIP